jgi:hypothetical protein
VANFFDQFDTATPSPADAARHKAPRPASTSNFFDQFDQPAPKGNFFDQFDAQPAADRYHDPNETGGSGGDASMVEDPNWRTATPVGRILAATVQGAAEPFQQPEAPGGASLHEMLEAHRMPGEPGHAN